MVFNIKFGPAMEAEEGTILNSNLFPVKAKGEVLFLSVVSLGRFGIVDTPIFSLPPFLQEVAPPFSICCKISVS